MSKEFQIRDGNLIARFDLENKDGDIDFCKLLKVSHGVAEEIGMFVDYVAINKIIKDQSKQISDLEAKLAESNESNHKNIVELIKMATEKDRKIEESKQQLAEKDEFLKKQKELFETVDRELYLTKDTLKHHTNIYNSLVESRNQDKISFALEQLEKVKEKVENRNRGTRQGHSSVEYKDGYSGCCCEITDYIDNQIKAIKGEK